MSNVSHRDRVFVFYFFFFKLTLKSCSLFIPGKQTRKKAAAITPSQCIKVRVATCFAKNETHYEVVQSVVIIHNHQTIKIVQFNTRAMAKYNNYNNTYLNECTNISNK